MSIETRKIQNYGPRLRELALSSSSDVVLLPSNLEKISGADDLIFESTTPTTEKILREAGIPVSSLSIEGDPKQRGRKGLEWIGPVILITSAVYMENPHVISMTVGVISNYLTDFFKGFAGDKKVKLDFVVENKDGYVQCSYEGPPEELDRVQRVLEQLRDEGEG